MKIIVVNKKAKFDYEWLEKFEAGLALMGSEAKSIRNGQVSLAESYVASRAGELYLQSALISEYKASSYNNHSPNRSRKLLLKKNEIHQIERSIQEKGWSCVPTKMYFKNGRVKVEIVLARGKDKQDKRQSIKQRDVKKQLGQALKKNKR